MNAPNPETDKAIDRIRFGRILFFFTAVTIHLVWWDLLLGRIFKKQIRSSRARRFRKISRRYRKLAVEMGGVMIKMGQFLSARVDMLPPEITEELTGLQDEVPAVPFEDIQVVLAGELGELSKHFSAFEDKPLAAASLGQAHRAWLLPNSNRRGVRGAQVVVKVQRPRIEHIVNTDIEALRMVARVVMKYPPIRRRADIPALLDEFSRTLAEELDYVSEADNAEFFGEMFANDGAIRIPGVYRQHSSRRVLVLEDVSGIKITDIEAMDSAGIDRSEVANRLLDAYFLQIFTVGRFHADPHPGNLFVLPLAQSRNRRAGAPRPFQLAFVDFGMTGRIEELMGDSLRKLLVSITKHDGRMLTEAYDELGFFLPGSDLERISEAQGRVLDHLWGRNLLELSQTDPTEFQEMGREFRDLLFEFPFQVPQDFIFLGRALGILSGLATMLDPTINPWRLAERYGQQILRSREGLEFGLETVAELLKGYLSIPSRLNQALSAAEDGSLPVKPASDPALLRRLDKMEKKIGRPNWSVLAAALLVTGTLLYLGEETAIATVALIFAALFLILSFIRI